MEKEKDQNTICMYCGKEKEEYEAMYCDTCYQNPEIMKKEGLKTN